jgi:hypothetical protein
MEFLNLNFTIPEKETTYVTIPFIDIPPEDSDVHVVGVSLSITVPRIQFEGIIYPKSKAFVHHFVLYGCENIEDESTCQFIW